MAVLPVCLPESAHCSRTDIDTDTGQMLFNLSVCLFAEWTAKMALANNNQRDT